MQDIQEYTDFLTFSNSIHDGLRIAKVIAISLIFATFCAVYTLFLFVWPHIAVDLHRSANFNEIQGHHSRTASGLAQPSNYSWWRTLSKWSITIACCGMPPTYVRRFIASLETYRRSFRPLQWHSFLDEVVKERAATNVVVCCCSCFLWYYLPDKASKHLTVWFIVSV